MEGPPLLKSSYDIIIIIDNILCKFLVRRQVNCFASFE